MCSSDNKEYKIYTLIDPITNEIRYIGATVTSLHRRLYKHLRVANRYPNSSKGIWIKSLQIQNLIPIILQIDTSSDIDKEKYWIKEFKDNGCELLNITNGGLGIFGNMDPEIENKYRNELKEKCSGWKHLEETVEKIRESAFKMWQNPEIKQRIIQANTGQTRTEETKLNISQSLLGKKFSDERKANLRKAWESKDKEAIGKKISESRKGKGLGNRSSAKTTIEQRTYIGNSTKSVEELKIEFNLSGNQIRRIKKATREGRYDV